MQSAVAAANVEHAGRHARRAARRRCTLAGDRPAARRRATIGRLIVAYRNGAPVRLDEVADGRSTASRTTRPRAGTTATRASCSRSSASPTPTPSRWSIASRRCCPSFEAQLPPSVDAAACCIDRSQSIRAAVDDVQFTLLLTDRAGRPGDLPLPAQLSRATLIPALALPISLIGTFAGMYVLGYSIDNISLLALTLSVGFVVDDAIVMLENIVRHVEDGERPFEAALKGSREIGFTIISITAVAGRGVHPGAVHGRHRRPAVPRVRRHHQRRHPDLGHRLADADADAVRALPAAPRPWRDARRDRTASSSAASTRARAATTRTLTLALRVAPLMLVVDASLPSSRRSISSSTSQGLLPDEDTGQIIVITEAGAGHLVRRDGRAQQATVADDHPGRSRTSPSSTRRSAPAAQHRGQPGRIFIDLKPRDRARPSSATQVIQELRPQAARASPASTSSCSRSRTSGSAARQSQEPVPVHAAERATSTSSTTGRAEMRSGCAGCRASSDVTSDLQITSPQAIVEIDRDKAARARRHRSTRSATTLYCAFGTRQVSTIYTADERLPGDPRGRPELPAGSRRAARSIYVRSSTGAAGAAERGRAVSRARPARSRVNHQSASCRRSRSRSTSRPGVSLGEAVERDPGGRARAELPATIITSFQGTAQVFQDSLRGQGAAAARRGARDLHRARHALRELHPPAHDPLRPAVGRRSARC